MATTAAVFGWPTDMMIDLIGFVVFVVDDRAGDQLIVGAGQVKERSQQFCSLLFESFLGYVALTKLEI